ncbi:MAG: hypothetical protein IH840_17275 [Candidatus Heimdallarchaeota archaeon]|nr:hypothetical protein [Candidatus Heimdallarchaeota archaeon]
MYTEILIIILHRLSAVGLTAITILSFFLPKILSRDEDFQPARRYYEGMLKASKVFLIISIITGIQRLLHGIPNLFAIKLACVGGVVYLFLVYNIEYLEERYYLKMGYRLISVLITGLAGLLI